MDFTFTDTWHLPADVDTVVAALADIERYPTWWPQVRSVTRIDEHSGRGVVRSLLPLRLDLVLTREVEDRGAGHLRVRLSGDLRGHAEWRVVAGAKGAEARFEQCVRVATRLERMATLVPWLLRANHAWMMRQGRRGLVAAL
ncbi:SRPBCC family protein [Janibacter corallicola]|uniref:SRPBCC family protein n=1 Tax=Janibacter corallicola TaxID=415212 RepID=UPI0008296027|nr:SRPBCC family protein [Janibacter corallicola]